MVEVIGEDGTTWSTDAFDIEGDPDTINVNLSSYDDEHNVTDDDGNEKRLGKVFNDRLENQGSDVDLIPEDRNGNPNQAIDHEESELYIDFEGDGRHITYLQVTENQIVVELN